MQDRNSLDNFGMLLQGAVDSTEDLTRSSSGGIITEQLLSLPPAMRIALIRDRITMREKEVEKVAEREGRLDSGLLEAPSEEQREEPVSCPTVRIVT